MVAPINEGLFGNIHIIKPWSYLCIFAMPFPKKWIHVDTRRDRRKVKNNAKPISNTLLAQLLTLLCSRSTLKPTITLLVQLLLTHLSSTQLLNSIPFIALTLLVQLLFHAYLWRNFQTFFPVRLHHWCCVCWNTQTLSLRMTTLWF